MGNVFGRTTRGVHAFKQVRGLEAINPELRLHYTLRWKYSGYKITDKIEVRRSTLSGYIKYIEKTPESEGIDKFLEQLERDARDTKCKQIRVEFDQCSKKMQEKLEKHARKKGFDCSEVPVFDEGMMELDRATGLNLQVYKEIKEEL